MKKARTISEERREDHCSLAAASLLLVVIGVGENNEEWSQSKRKILISVNSKSKARKLIS